jgi:Mn2+/Fe2+ NRAMP family transporter
MLAVPVLAGSAAYAVGETFGWRTGLNERWWKAPSFYAVYLAATGLGVIMNFSGVSPMEALFFTSLLMGFVAPPLVALTVLIARDGEVMRDQRIGPWTAAAGWITAAITAVAVLAYLATLFVH